MKFRKLKSEFNNKKFIIEEDLPNVGAYFIVYDGEKSTHDYLQDNIEMCKQFALEDFNVPIDSWIEIENS